MSDEPGTLVAIGGPMHGKRVPDLGIRVVVPRDAHISAIDIGDDQDMPSTHFPTDLYLRRALMGDGWSADIYMWDRKASAPL